ncbi:MAG: ABC transporter permease [Longimicrobiales bacterium]
MALFPPTLRRKSGPEMARMYEAMYDEARRERERPGLRFWARVLWDAGRHAAAAWVAASRTRGRGPDGRRGETMIRSIASDIRFALRQLTRHPLYAGMVVLLVAVGIAGNAAVFRIFNGMFLQPLPFAEADRLVDLDERADEWNLDFTGMAWADFQAWRENNRSFESMAVFTSFGRNLADEAGAERVSLVAATHDLDDVLRLQPVLGRFFGPAEDVDGGARVVMLTEAYWTDRFGGRADVLGSALTLNGEPYEIIGVLPPEAELLQAADMWTPLQGSGSGWYLQGLGRLADGIDPAVAQEDLTAIHKGMLQERPVNRITTPVVTPLRERFLGGNRLGAGLLLGAVGLLLLIACANIAGLVLARSFSRADELAVRQALGARRGRLVRQLLTESLLLGMAGGAVGLAVGVAGSNLLVDLLADANQFPLWVRFDLDARFLAFVLVVSVGATALFGLIPALRTQPAPGAGAAGRSSTSRGRRRAMQSLVAAQVGLAAVLLVVGGLTVLDVRRLASVDPGFRVEGLLTFRYSLPSNRYPDDDSRFTYAATLLERLNALPDVEAATSANLMPLFDHQGWFFTVEDAPPRSQDEGNPVVLMRGVMPGYFEALGLELAQGRTFDDFDGRDETQRVAIVNEEFVRSHMGGDADPLGRRIASGTDRPEDDSEWRTVVGVVRDARHYGVDADMRPGVFLPQQELAFSYGQVAVRAAGGDPDAVVDAVRSAALEVDPEVPPYALTTMADRFDQTLFTRTASAWLFALFAGVALLLAVAGIYGVISYAVGQRRQEISIRMAMGAERVSVLRSVVIQGMTMVGLGLVGGLVVAVAAAGRMGGLLVDVSATEPTVYVVVAVTLLAVAAVANYVPARRAARMDPMGVLRGE